MQDKNHYKVMKKLFLLILVSILQAGLLHAGSERQLLREGNKLYEEGRYAEAEEKFRKSLEIDADNYKAKYNLGNALYRQGRLEEAAELYNEILQRLPAYDARASAYHNLGNTLLGQGDIAESIEAYKKALRLAPDNEDTRYNLAYALNLLDEMPPDAPEPEPDADYNNDEDNDEQAQPEGNDDQQDDQDEPGTPENVQDEPGMADMPERPDQLTPEDAERILEALLQQEQKIQEEINREDQEGERVRTLREW